MWKKERKINIFEKGNILFGFCNRESRLFCNFGEKWQLYSNSQVSLWFMPIYSIYKYANYSYWFIWFSIKVIKCICEAARVATEVLWCALQMYLSIGKAAQSLNHKTMAVGMKTKPLKGDFFLETTQSRLTQLFVAHLLETTHLRYNTLTSWFQIKQKQTQAMS